MTFDGWLFTIALGLVLLNLLLWYPRAFGLLLLALLGIVGLFAWFFVIRDDDDRPRRCWP